MSDTTVLLGMGKLLNPLMIKSGVNIDDLERKMAERGISIDPQHEVDPTDRFNTEMEVMARTMGISLDKLNIKSGTGGGGGNNIVETNLSTPRGSLSTPRGSLSTPRGSLSTPKHGVSFVEGSSGGYGGSLSTPTPRNNMSMVATPRNFGSVSGFGGDDIERSTKYDATAPFEDEKNNKNIDDDDDDDTPPRGFGPKLTSPVINRNNAPIMYGNSANIGNSNETTFERTQEQERQMVINSVVSDTEDKSFSLEREKEEDLKATMLEEIDELREILSDEGVDISRVAVVTRDDSFQTVNDVLKSLRYKNDSCRYRTMAEEVILFGAQGLEDLFDGRRVWMGRRPDLTGWSKQLNSKLRRMRTDTSRVVSSVMRDYDIGPAARILLELVPNAFMYSRSRKRQSDSPSIFADEEISKHISNIRDVGI